MQFEADLKAWLLPWAHACAGSMYCYADPPGSFPARGSHMIPGPLLDLHAVRGLDVWALAGGQHQSQVCGEGCGPGGWAGMVAWWSVASHPVHGGLPNVYGSGALDNSS